MGNCVLHDIIFLTDVVGRVAGRLQGVPRQRLLSEAKVGQLQDAHRAWKKKQNM